MCGDLRRERLDQLAGKNPQGLNTGTWTKVHKEAQYEIDGNTQQSLWNGHARSEVIGDWIRNGWTVGYLHAGAFTEGHPPKVFQVPQGKMIKIVHRVVNHMGKPMRIFNIVTREAQGEEKSIHNRFPVLVDKE